jgi:hypothetical protein
MINDSYLSKILRIVLIQVPVFALTVIIYGLSVSILNDTVTSASIASSQFAGDGVSLTGIFTGVIVLGAFNLFILIGLFVVGSILKYWSWYILTLGLINLLFNLISEAIFFKFATCFNFPSNAIVVARSTMVILLMVIMFCVAGFALVHFLLRGETLEEKLGALLGLLLLLPSIVMLVLNAILIARLSPQLNYFIEPSSLRMGFFNPLEMGQIQNGNYAKTNTFEQQIIGNLGDVIFSPNKVLAYTECTRDSKGRRSCTYYYLHTYLYQITCTNQSVLFYKDCSNNAFSLTIHVTYLDSGPYPSYNCLVNQANETCASLCTQLLSNYQLILIQEFKPNQIQPAWTGLSNCHTNINIQLTHNSVLNPCSNNALNLASDILMIFAFIGILFLYF